MKSREQFFNVSVDYRTAGWPGCTIRTVKASDGQAAAELVIADLTKQYINLKIDNVYTSRSGWNR